MLCGDESTEQFKQKFVVMGCVGAPYGIKGWHHIHSFAQPIDNILRHNTWYVQQKGKWVPYRVAEGRSHNQGIVARLGEIDNRDRAAELANAKIAVLRTELEPLAPEEFYWTDLENLTVQTKSGTLLGQVDYVYQNAGTDIMVIKGEGDKEHHIPFLLHDTVVKVDVNSRQVIVDWDLAK